MGPLRLNFWDLGGQEELHSLWQKYFEDSHAMIFVIDACDVDRLSDVKTAFGSFFLVSRFLFIILWLLYAHILQFGVHAHILQFSLLILCNKLFLWLKGKA